MKPRLPIKKCGLFIFLLLFLLSPFFLQDILVVHADTVSGSKLGVFILGQSEKASTIIDSGPRVIKVMDPQNNPTFKEYVRQYKEKYPDGLVVLRVFEGTVGRGYSLEDDPVIAAQDFWNNVLSPALAKLGSDRDLFDYVSGPNEFDNTPMINSQESVDWTNSFWLQLAALIAEAGFKPLLGEIPVGNLGPEHLDGLVPSLRFIKSKGGAFSYHAYTLKYATDVNDEYYYSLHYRQFYEYFFQKHPDLVDLPMILTEAGVDESGDRLTSGWQARGDASQYQRWLLWFDDEIKKDQYILGSTIFQLGDTHWSSFNIEPIVPWLASYISGSPLPIEEGGISTTSECDETFWGGVKAKILEGVGDLLAFLGVKVLPGLKTANLASLPKDVMDEKKLADCPEDKEANVLAQVSQNYGVASSRFTPESIPSKLSFFTQLFADFKRLVYEGEDKAGKFVKADLPMGVGEEVLAQRVETIAFRQSASEQDSQVLGFLGTKEIMKDALAIKRCANLPSSAFKDGDCVETLASLASAEVSPTPGASPSPGTCELGTGYCSVGNLIQYFGDESIARQASQICRLESGGDPFALNDRCLPTYPENERTRDYSVGLFQINLLAHCSGALEDNWDTDKSCRIININRLNECQNRLENPEENIKEALRIYRDWGNWSAWRRAATLCGFLE